MADFVYGNTRLRARKAALLGRADYESMLGLDPDELLGALSRTAYRPDVEGVLQRSAGGRRLHDAVRAHLARALDEMRRFYTGPARELVDLLLARWDLRNLLTLLRGQAARAPADEVLAYVVPLGGIDDASAREVARQQEFAAAVQLLGAWRLPTPAHARSLVAAWPEYERTGDLAALEGELVRVHAEHVAAALDRLGDDTGPLRDAHVREVDARNLLAALRLRQALAAGETDDSGPELERRAALAGGKLSRATRVAVLRAAAPEDVATALARDPAGAPWIEALGRWVRGGDLVALEDELDARLLREAVALFHRGDPLSVAIPVAYAAAKEAEARNVRVLGEAALRGADLALARSRLLLA